MLKAKSIAKYHPDWIYWMHIMAAQIHEEKECYDDLEDKNCTEEYEELTIKFQRTIIKMRQQNNYQIGAIGNKDETPMNIDMPPSRSVNAVGEKTVLIKTTGNEKNYLLLYWHVWQMALN